MRAIGQIRGSCCSSALRSLARCLLSFCPFIFLPNTAEDVGAAEKPDLPCHGHIVRFELAQVAEEFGTNRGNFY
jgi:hypothetical protein